MRDAAQRLVQDLKWRLSPAGRKYRPDARTLKSWGVTEVHSSVPVLLWFAWFFASIIIGFNLEWPMAISLILFGPPSWIAAGYLFNSWIKKMNHARITKAYKQILDGNERFLLIEYTRYIRRKIRLAESDPVLGGPDEVKRLKQTHRKLRQILEKGRQGDSVFPVRSILGDEADFAESLIEVYDRPEDEDPLAELDARLPDDIRSRLDEFEDDNRAADRRRMEHQ